MPLDSRVISRHHGAFLFERGILRYVDFRSSNGTRINSVPLEAGGPVDITAGSVIWIGPFQIVVHLERVFDLDMATDTTQQS